MDCESCGRYRPSSEISPLRAAGRLLMACARCRRLTALRRTATAAPDRAGAPALSPGTALAMPR